MWVTARTVKLFRIQPMSQAINLEALSNRLAAALAIRAGSIAATVGAGIVLARALGVEQFGSYNYAVAIAALVALPLTSGTPQLITRLVATYRGSQGALLAGLTQTAGHVALWGGVLAAFFTAAIVVAVGEAGNLEPMPTFLAAVVLIPVNALAAARAAELTGFGHVVEAQMSRLLVAPAVLLSLSAVLWWWSGQLDSTTAILLRAAGVGCALVVAMLRLRQARPPSMQREYRSRDWLRSAAPLALLGGLQIVTTSTDKLMLGILDGPASVGIYSPAVQGSALVIVVLNVLNSTISPNIVRLHTSGDRKALQQLATWTARRALVAGLPAALLMATAGEPLLRWFYGAPYAAGAGALAILAIAQLANAGLGSVGLLLTMTGHEHDAARGVFVVAVFNVAANLVLIPPFGVTGAAIATASSLILWNVLLAVKVRRRLGVDSSFLGLHPGQTGNLS